MNGSGWSKVAKGGLGEGKSISSPTRKVERDGLRLARESAQYRWRRVRLRKKNRVASARIRRIRLAMAEPAMMELRADDLDDGPEVRRAVTIGVTIWERRMIS